MFILFITTPLHAEKEAPPVDPSAGKTVPADHEHAEQTSADGPNSSATQTAAEARKHQTKNTPSSGTAAGDDQASAATSPDANRQLSEGDRRFFEEKIRPILVRRCYECHGPDAEDVGGQLRLDHRRGLLDGGYRGPAIVPGHPEKSLLIEAIEYGDSELQMPPDSKLPAAEIALLREWITRGAPDPRELRAKQASQRSAMNVAQRAAEHWAWHPPQRSRLPAVDNKAWPLDRLDFFILARLEAAGIEPAPDAERHVWLRRVTYDLRGLPPTPDEVADFLADSSAEAYERVVDRLLAEPAFGECWAQHWLDLVRFAETKGHEQDFDIPYAWRYRDYVIRAFNQNVPYDVFVVEHVAGDLVDPPRIDAATRTNQSIQGTGFWHLGEATHSPVDIRGEEADRIANQLDVFGKAFLGLALGCTRCHDHKFDALTTADYYALCGFLQSSSYQLADVSDVVAQRECFQSLQRLRSESVGELSAAYARSRIPRLPAFGKALLQAADSLSLAELGQQAIDAQRAAPSSRTAPSDANRSESQPPATHEPMSSSASQKNANAADISPTKRLSQELIEASHHPEHPLHAVAVAVRFEKAAAAESAEPLANRTEASAPEVPSRNSSPVAGAVALVLERWAQLELSAQQRQEQQMIVVTQKQGEGSVTTTRRPFDPARDTIADFSQFDPREWFTSGYRMGSGPLQAGTVLLGSAADRVLERVLPRSAATGDALSRRFTGFLRTRTFEVVGDTLWYRYRGKADVFLAVDSHRTVHGPLHGIVKQKLESLDRVTWFGHRVADYLGHRVHVEFTPTGPFELYEVRFGSDAPPAEFHVNRLLRNALANRSPQTVQDVVDATVGAMQQAIQWMATGLEGRPMVRDAAELINWVLSHDSLIMELPANDLPDEALQAAEHFKTLAKRYTTRRAEIEAAIPEPIFALALLDGSGENERIHLRGNHRRLAEQPTPRRFFEVLDGPEPMPIDHGSGRLELARRLVAKDNPLTARVFVNRVLHYLLGRGIVATVDDFGAMGSKPTHPKLLDDLAVDFVQSGWNIKQLVRRVVLSRTYRMASHCTDEAERADAANQLFHRAAIRRLTAEQIRDAILAVSARLDRRLYGPSVRIHITEFMRHNRSPKWSGPRDGNGRRSIYIEVRRNHLSHFLAAFDRPLPATTVGRRNVSNSAAQPLILLNDPFVYDHARHWAERLIATQADESAMLHAAYMMAFSRPPTPAEKECVAAYRSATEHSGETAQQRLDRWTEICHALLNVKEFIFLK